MNLSAFAAALCSLKFSDMATPLVDGCVGAFIVSPNGVATIYLLVLACFCHACSVFFLPGSVTPKHP